MDEDTVSIKSHLLPLSENMLESYDFTIALRSNRNQALRRNSTFLNENVPMLIDKLNFRKLGFDSRTCCRVTHRRF